MDPKFNPFVRSGIRKFLCVQDAGVQQGIAASGYVPGVDFDRADSTTLPIQFPQLGRNYAAIVIGWYFGNPRQTPNLEYITSRSDEIMDFVNQGGGLVATSECLCDGGLIPQGGFYGFLPFVIPEFPFGAGVHENNALTEFGLSLGLVPGDVNYDVMHNAIRSAPGMQVVDTYIPGGQVVSVASRGRVDRFGVVTPYLYDVEAIDPDDDTLTYSLTNFPSGMSIDSATGIIRWTPTAAQIGPHNVAVQVSA